MDDLQKHDLFTEDDFTEKPQNQWTDEYTRFLAGGFASGHFSREYLQHCAEVAKYLHEKKRRSKTLLFCGIAGLIVVGLLVAFCRS
jgi:hypothetical protein